MNFSEVLNSILSSNYTNKFIESATFCAVKLCFSCQQQTQHQRLRNSVYVCLTKCHHEWCYSFFSFSFSILNRKSMHMFLDRKWFLLQQFGYHSQNKRKWKRMLILPIGGLEMNVRSFKVNHSLTFESFLE